MINITHHNGLGQYIHFGPMSYGEPILGSPVEPGMTIQQRTLVERVEFEKRIGRYPEWVAYTLGSKKIHLNPGLELKASWPEGGLQPYFRKDYEFDLPDRAGNRITFRVLTQSSLDESADVYFVNVLSELILGFVAYKIPLLTLQEMLTSSPKKLIVPVRQHHRRS